MLFFLKIVFAVAIALFLIVLTFFVLKKQDETAETVEFRNDSEDDEIENPVSDFDGYVTSKKILTDNEAYNLKRLLDNLPEGVILCPQVNFCAFIKCDKMSIRNRFNRKFCDYLIVDSDYNPLLIVEADDDSHTSKKVRLRDLQRDEIAAAAGIPTLRITNKTPSEDLGHLIKSHIQKAA
jgi:hypothetical protein